MVEIASNDHQSLEEMNITSKQSYLTKLEREMIEEEEGKQSSIPVRAIPIKMDDKFTLNCGHEGRVVRINPDGKSFWVQGVRGSCKNCGKRSSGSWTPTVYLFSYTENQEVPPIKI